MDISINDDAFFEDNESFRLTLSGADADASASTTLDYTINQNNSDDQLPVISFETSSEESFTENGSSNLDQTITVKLIDDSTEKAFGRESWHCTILLSSTCAARVSSPRSLF